MIALVLLTATFASSRVSRAYSPPLRLAGHLGDQTVLTRSKQTVAKIGEPARIATNEHRQKLMTADQIWKCRPTKCSASSAQSRRCA